LQADLDKMAFKTIQMNREVTKYILENIKEIKSMIDPCEIRVKRTIVSAKPQDIKHPFFIVPMTQQDICLIGNLDEI
jgi:recombinational DNA repair protein RecR